MAEAKLKITADTSQADRAIKSLSSTLDGLKTVAGLAIGALVGRATIGAIGDFISAASEAQTNLQGVATALGRMGSATKGSLKEIEDFSKNLSNLTGVSDDAAQKAFTLAASFGATKDQAKDMVKAAVQLSAATGKDLDSSIQLLGSSLDGTAGKLATLSPAIRNLTAEQLKAGEAAKVLIAQFGGTAEAQLNTFGGAVNNAKNQFGELQESIGNIIVQNPVIIAVIKKVSEGIQDLTKFLDLNGAALRTKLNAGIITMISGFQKLATPVKFVVSLFEDIFNAATLLSGSFIQVISSISKLSLGSAFIKSFALGVTTTFKAVIDTMGLFAAGLRSVLELVGLNLSGNDLFFAQISQSIDGLEEKIVTLDIPKALDQSTAAIADFATTGEKAFDAIREGIDKTADSLGSFVKDLLNLPNTVEAPKVISQGGGPVKDQAKTLTQDEVAKAFLGGLEQGGRAGAQTIVGAVGIGVATIFGLSGPVAQGIGQFISFVGQDPDTFKGAIDGLLDGIPDVIDAIVKNIPYLVVSIAEHTGPIITALASAMPQVAIALAKAMPLVAEALELQVAQGFGYQLQQLGQGLTKAQNDIANAGGVFAEQVKVGLGKGISDAALKLKNAIPDIANALKKELVDIFKTAGEALTVGISNAGIDFFNSVVQAGKTFIDNVTPGGGGGKSIIGTNRGPITGKKGAFLATGGTVPGGYANDSFLAGLTSGETVVPKDDVNSLRSFLNEQQNGLVPAILGQILAALQTPQQVSTTIQVDGDKLANAILNLNRRNARLTA